ncbi:MAG: response regulator [Sporomusaceae bacterium]|nr:response regulator [Sporomusaceae bacterium]
MARIMIVDDALMMRTVLRKIFEKAGHEVVAEAVNGENAIQEYPRCGPDIVTMDLTMPGLGGIGALKGIMKIDPLAKVIVVSALGQKHVIFEALQEGAKNYIIKPLQAEKLLSAIDIVLNEASFCEAK